MPSHNFMKDVRRLETKPHVRSFQLQPPEILTQQGGTDPDLMTTQKPTAAAADADDVGPPPAGEGKDLAWTCPCGNVVRKKRCGNCKAWKGGTRASYTKKRTRTRKIDAFIQGRCHPNAKPGAGTGVRAAPLTSGAKPSSGHAPPPHERFVAGLRSYISFQIGTCLDSLGWVAAASLLRVATRDFPFLANTDWDEERKVRRARFQRVEEAKNVAAMASRVTRRERDTAGNAASKNDGKQPRSQGKKRKRVREAEEETSQEAGARVGRKATKYGILTAENALKLANAGFAFDASHIHKRPKGNKVAGEEDDSSEDWI